MTLDPTFVSNLILVLTGFGGAFLAALWISLVIWTYRDIRTRARDPLVQTLATLLVAVLICWRTKHMISEFTHNLAIIFWISANSLWMISEFFNWGDDFRYWALIPFGLGLITLIYYYAFYAPWHKSGDLRQQSGDLRQHR